MCIDRISLVKGQGTLFATTRAMEQNKNQNYEKAETLSQREFIMVQSHCVLCGGNLELKHTRDSQLTIKEEARCPHCDIRTRAKNFILH